MELHKDTGPVDIEETIAKMLREQSGEMLASVKEAVKRKILRATLQQAIAELGDPEEIAQQAFATWEGAEEALRRAGGALTAHALQDVARRGVEALRDVDAAAAEAMKQVDPQDEVLQRARAATAGRLIEQVAHRSVEALQDADAAAAQAMEHVREQDEALVRARAHLKERILEQVLGQALEEISEEVQLAGGQDGLSLLQAAPRGKDAAPEPVAAPEETPPAEIRTAPEADSFEQPEDHARGDLYPDDAADEHISSDGASLVAEPAPSEMMALPDVLAASRAAAAPEPAPEPASEAPGAAPAAARPAAPAEAYYVYAVVDAEDAFSEEALPTAALDPAHAPYLVTYKGLQAVVSKVALPDFSEEALPANLKDAEWKRTYKGMHITLLEQLAAGPDRTVVPRPFGTICRSDEAVEEMLAEHYNFFQEALARLRGKREWGVKIYGDAERLEQVVLGKTRKMEGFLGELPDVFASRIKQEMNSSLREEIEVISESCAKYSHNMLLSTAEEGILHPTPMGEGGPTLLIMHAAYLVEQAAEENFAATLERLAAKHGEVGFTYDTTGPRPPLSFCE